MITIELVTSPFLSSFLSHSTHSRSVAEVHSTILIICDTVLMYHRTPSLRLYRYDVLNVSLALAVQLRMPSPCLYRSFVKVINYHHDWGILSCLNDQMGQSVTCNLCVSDSISRVSIVSYGWSSVPNLVSVHVFPAVNVSLLAIREVHCNGTIQRLFSQTCYRNFGWQWITCKYSLSLLGVLTWLTVNVVWQICHFAAHARLCDLLSTGHCG